MKTFKFSFSSCTNMAFFLSMEVQAKLLCWSSKDINWRSRKYEDVRQMKETNCLFLIFSYKIIKEISLIKLVTNKNKISP